MTHYNLLKLKDPFDTEKVLTQCKAVYAELEAELDFLHDASVTRCIRLQRRHYDGHAHRLARAARRLSSASQARGAVAGPAGRRRGKNVL